MARSRRAAGPSGSDSATAIIDAQPSEPGPRVSRYFSDLTESISITHETRPSLRKRVIARRRVVILRLIVAGESFSAIMCARNPWPIRLATD
jgi:hypothetical protein